MSEPQPADVIVRTVIGLLEEGGYDAVHLREVARQAQVSLTTVYKLFPTRDELIATAVEQWMAVNGCAQPGPPPPGESLYGCLMRLLRHVFEPWERNPRMLEVYYRAAQAGAGAERLIKQAYQVIEPTAWAMLDDYEPAYVADLALILTHIAHGVVARFAAGEIPITEILPLLERTVYRLTADNRPGTTRRPHVIPVPDQTASDRDD
ncbi:TetR family transcriptional regulator [Actinocorallia populi]|uniref:TetR family transcriptional regulator n=1 Tax=Actinocorallia populi TaxID=2079200 RepID=UPI000D090201|nr:TetR family transcriptional regulator [Actinocorallia populi]